MRRILRIVSAALVLLFVVPTALAKTGSTPVYVNNIMLDESNSYWKNGETAATSTTSGDWNAYYNAATNTLTLRNAVLNTPRKGGVDPDDYSLVYSSTNLNLILEGTNTFTASVSTDQYVLCIYAFGDLTIAGSGSATLRATNTGTGMAFGILNNGVMTISGAALDMDIHADASDTYGIFSEASLTVNSGTIKIKSTAMAGRARGIFGDSPIELKGGNLNIESISNEKESSAITTATLSHDITISGATVTAKATSNSTKNYCTAIGGENIYLKSGSGTFTTAGTGMLFGGGFKNISHTGGHFEFSGTVSALGYLSNSTPSITSVGSIYASTAASGAAKTLWDRATSGTLYSYQAASIVLSDYKYVEFGGTLSPAAEAVLYPATGDTAAPWLWVSLLLCAFVGLLGLTLRRRSMQ